MPVIITLGNPRSSAPGTGGGSSGDLSGAITNASGGAAVPGGRVDVMSGNVILATTTVDGSGNYSFTGLAPGTCTVRHSPTLAWSAGTPSTNAQSVTISGTPQVASFTVQAAYYSDTFQSYTTTTLQRTPPQSGDFWFSTGGGLAVTHNNGSTIVMDPTGGNSTGVKAAQYLLPAGGPSGMTTSLQPFLSSNTGLGFLPNLWTRVTSKESSGFTVGDSSHFGTSAEYKFILNQIGETGAGVPQFGVYLNKTGPDSTIAVKIDMNDRVGHTASSGLLGTNYALGSSWDNQYHTWVSEMLGLNTGACTFNLYLDGALIITLGPIQQDIGSGGTYFALGANFNNGPEADQSRWFREFGVYTSKPSLLPMVP